jgi:MFS family permease
MLRLSVALLLVQAGFYGFTVSIPLALAAAGRSDAEIGFVVGIAALVQIGAALAGGTLIDRVGAMRMFLIGGVCYGVACGLLLLAAPKLELVPLVVARVLQGTGQGSSCRRCCRSCPIL